MSEATALSKVRKNLRKEATSRGISFNAIATQYLLECMTRRLLTDMELSGKVVFKGGYVCARVYSSPRHTTDVDITISGMDIDAVIRKLSESVTEKHQDCAWFVLRDVSDLIAQGEYGGKRIVFRGGIGEQPSNIQRGQVFQLDIGINDLIRPSPVEVTTDSLSGTGVFTWVVYSIETVVAEKLHTLVDRGSENSRSRDVFDLHLLVPRCKPDLLREAINATFAHRGISLPPDLDAVLQSIDTTLLEKGWKRVCLNANVTLAFDEVYSQLLSALKTLRI